MRRRRRRRTRREAVRIEEHNERDREGGRARDAGNNRKRLSGDEDDAEKKNAFELQKKYILKIVYSEGEKWELKCFKLTTRHNN